MRSSAIADPADLPFAEPRSSSILAQASAVLAVEEPGRSAYSRPDRADLPDVFDEHRLPPGGRMTDWVKKDSSVSPLSMSSG